MDVTKRLKSMNGKLSLFGRLQLSLKHLVNTDIAGVRKN